MAITVVNGAPSATNGSAPTPTIPGTPQLGDWMVAVFASREATDGTVSLPAGWDQRVNDRGTGGLVAAWTRPWQTGDTAPTFTLGGHATGASGDSAIAAICLIRPTPGKVLRFVDASVPSHNAASSTTVGPIDGDTLSVAPAGIVFVLGQHRETWTGHTTLTGDGLTWAEAIEASNSAGADNAMALDYALSDNVAITDKSFTISGSGGSATGAGFMLFFAEEILSTQFDYPNPTKRPAGAQYEGWTQNLLQSTLAPVEQGPFVPVMFENPQVPGRAVALRTGISGRTIVSPAVIPVGSAVQELPVRVSLRPQDFALNLLASTLAPVEQAPFAAAMFENPVRPVLRPQDFFLNLLETTLAEPPGAPVPTFNWDNPVRRQWPVSLLTGVSGRAINPPQPQAPHVPLLFDNPVRLQRAAELLTWAFAGLADSPLTAPVSTPFVPAMFENPQRRKHPVSLLTLASGRGINPPPPVVPGDPFIPPDFPNPLRPRRAMALLTGAHGRAFSAPPPIVLGVPFKQHEWPNPRIKPFPVSLRTFLLQPQDQGMVGQAEFPTPPTLEQPNLYGVFASGAPLSLTETDVGDPFTPVDLPNPARPTRELQRAPWLYSHSSFNILLTPPPAAAVPLTTVAGVYHIPLKAHPVVLDKGFEGRRK